MSRVLVLIDGEHYPAVVRAAIDGLARQHEVVAACFAGGTEKIDESAADYGVPLTSGPDARVALDAAIERYAPEVVMDLSDEPVVSSGDRFRLASVALARGVSYLGADFQFDPIAIEAEIATPTLAIVGTGKRVGKTAVSAHAARLLAGNGMTPVVLAMGRGGPATPELIRGDQVELATADLLALARRGIHAASDSYEDAAVSRVATVGCRRCGGGMAGSVFFSNVAEGAALAESAGGDVVLLEGSGSAVPPVVADATMLVVGAGRGAGYVSDYFAPLRVGAADAVVIAGAEPALVPQAHVDRILSLVRQTSPDVPVSVVTLRPRPLSPVNRKRVFFATTAPDLLMPLLAKHLEREHGCRVVAWSANLSDRPRLRADLERAAGTYDVLLTELKAAAIDVVAEAGERAGIPTVLVDNVPETVSGDDLDSTIVSLAEMARGRCSERGGRGV